MYVVIIITLTQLIPSNVIEKCVTHSSKADRAAIIEEVCAMSEGLGSFL